MTGITNGPQRPFQWPHNVIQVIRDGSRLRTSHSSHGLHVKCIKKLVPNLYIDCSTTRKKSEPHKCAKMGSQTPLGYFKAQNIDFHKFS